MAIRSGLGALFFLALLAVPGLRPAAKPAAGDIGRISGSAVSGIFLGMTLLMAALAVGDVGIVTTLSSTTPILILPMVWFVTRRAPGPCRLGRRCAGGGGNRADYSGSGVGRLACQAARMPAAAISPMPAKPSASGIWAKASQPRSVAKAMCR